MTEWIPISRTLHKDAYWKPRSGFQFAETQCVVLVLIAELSKLLPHFALGFLKKQDHYEAVALLGMDGSKNLYVNSDGKWIGSYTPAMLRAFPFALAKSGDEQVLCIDSEHLCESELGEKLFKESGELSDRVDEILAFLNSRDGKLLETAHVVNILHELELFEVWPVKIVNSSTNEIIEIQGLYRINELKLMSLDAESLLQLRQSGALALVYAQLFSINQIEQLEQRMQFHQEYQRAPEHTDADYLFEEHGNINLENI